MSLTLPRRRGSRPSLYPSHSRQWHWAPSDKWLDSYQRAQSVLAHCLCSFYHCDPPPENSSVMCGAGVRMKAEASKSRVAMEQTQGPCAHCSPLQRLGELRAGVISTFVLPAPPPRNTPLTCQAVALALWNDLWTHRQRPG